MFSLRNKYPHYPLSSGALHLQALKKGKKGKCTNYLMEYFVVIYVSTLYLNLQVAKGCKINDLTLLITDDVKVTINVFLQICGIYIMAEQK